MRRADRLFELIEILRRASRPISAEVIAAELEVSKRTVYRDIAALMAQRVPILGEAGVGYVLEPGFHMPPLMLTADEIEAAILGAQWVQTRGEPELAHAAAGLIGKIAAISPDSAQAIFAEPATSVAPVETARESLGSAEIRAAIRHGRKIRLAYRDTSDTVSERTVWPVLLGYRDAGRILAAWCELRQDFRYFRTERILEAAVLTETVPERLDLLRRRLRSAMDKERARFAAESKTPRR